jgi:hypothetical protein
MRVGAACLQDYCGARQAISSGAIRQCPVQQLVDSSEHIEANIGLYHCQPPDFTTFVSLVGELVDHEIRGNDRSRAAAIYRSSVQFTEPLISARPDFAETKCQVFVRGA